VAKPTAIMAAESNRLSHILLIQDFMLKKFQKFNLRCTVGISLSPIQVFDKRW